MSDDQTQRKGKQRGRGHGTGSRQHTGHMDDVAAAYVLGALEPAERTAIERHCRRCPRCTRLVEAHRRTVSFLPFLAPPATPRPEVKAILLARVAGTQAATASPTIAPRPRPMALLPPSRPTAAESLISDPPLDVAGTRKRWRHVPFPARPYLIAPLVLALALVGFWAFDGGGLIDERPVDRQPHTGLVWSDNGFDSTGQSSDTGDIEGNLRDGSAISDTPLGAPNLELGLQDPVLRSRIGDGLLAVTGVRVDVGHGTIVARPVSMSTTADVHTAGVPA